MIADFTRLPNQPISQGSHAAGKRTSVPSRLLAFLAICTTTSGLLATTPSAAFSGDANFQMKAAAIHLTCVKEAEHFICEPEKTGRTGENLGQHQGNAGETKVTATVVPQFLNPPQQELISNILLGLTFFLPIGLSLGIWIYERYANYCSAFLKQQVEVLERIWQESH